MVQVYDRSTGEILEEEQYGGAAANLLYDNPVGRFLRDKAALKPKGKKGAAAPAPAPGFSLN